MFQVSDVKSFDIILFSGEGFISSAIKLVSGSKWSHVALAVEDFDGDEMLCYESTTLSELPDITTGAKVKGVQLVSLEERIDMYEGDVACKQLLPALNDFESLYKANEFIDEFAGTPYEENQIELLKSALDMTQLGQNQPDTSSLFCSELTALMLRRVNVLTYSSALPANEFTPADFAGNGIELNHPYIYDTELQLLKGSL